MVNESTSTKPAQQAGQPLTEAPFSLVWPPLAASIVATAGSLWLSLGMGLKACPLCFYQRTFAMSTLGVLGIGAMAGKSYRGLLNLLAVPMAIGGAGVAAFHVYLEWSGKLECPPGILGLGTSPQQSLAILLVLAVLVCTSVVRAGWTNKAGRPVALFALAAGVMFAVSAVQSAPPLPKAPTKPYETPFDTCRPPFES